MKLKNIASHALDGLRIGLGSLALFQFAIGAPLAYAAAAAPISSVTHTPIKHVFVIIGENRSFAHVFATYVPKGGDTVWNLLSEGIVRSDGTPGPNFNKAQQRAALDPTADAFLLNPPKTAFPNGVLPAPLVGGPTDSYVAGDSLTLAQQSENGLPVNYYQYLVSGGTGLTAKTPDTRITEVNLLPPGPFQLTNGGSFVYNSYAASPVNRLYQICPKLDCGLEHATAQRPSGCDGGLFSWVEVTVGAGTNGLPQPSNFSTEYSPNAKTTGEGSTALGFYNVQHGDVPYFKELADNYAMSDNFHQSVNGGTGANHIMLGHGDAIWFSDGNGHAAEPPQNVEVAIGSANQGIVSEVENPNPAAGTNNWYAEDGYGGGSFGAASFGGGSYSECANSKQPGVAAINKYLQSLPRPIEPR